jgi:hypothetical protein
MRCYCERGTKKDGYEEASVHQVTVQSPAAFKHT